MCSSNQGARDTVIGQYLIQTYGPRLTLEDLGKVLGKTSAAIRTDLCKGTFPMPTYRDGNKLFVDVRDVTEYLDRKREVAHGACPRGATGRTASGGASPYAR